MSAAKTTNKAKAPADAVVVPQTVEEARLLLAEYGRAVRAIERMDADLNDQLAAVKARALDKAAPIAKRADELFDSLQTFCTAHRMALTRDGKTKTINLGSGKASWRNSPAKVELTGEAEEIIERIQRAGAEYSCFLKEAVKIDKVGILRNPRLAETIEGVTIAPATEVFTLEAFASEEVADVTS